MAKHLTNRQKVFIAEYLRDFNATRAAKAAGYSERSAYSIGQENLKKPEISAAITAEIAERSMSADEVLTRLADIARGDIAELMDITTSGFTLELATIDDNGKRIVNPKTKLIRKIKQKVTTIMSEQGDDREIIETEVELYNAQEALNTLAKHHKLFTDQDVSVTLNPSQAFSEMLDKVYGPKVKDKDEDHAAAA